MLTGFRSAIQKLQSKFSPEQSGAKDTYSFPGLYHYDRQGNGERSRIHLRIDADGSGLLLVNANRVIRLNPTAAFMAWLVLEEKSEHEATRSLVKRYRASFTREPPTGDGNYEVSHSSAIYVFDRGGNPRVLATPADSQDDLVHDLHLLLDTGVAP